MTLRPALSLLIAILAAISVAAFANVWDQLQNKGDRTVLAKIMEFEPALNRIEIEYREVGQDDPSPKSIQICRDDSSNSNASAVEYHHLIQSVREAHKSGEIVRLSMKGPWSPCLSRIAQVK